MSRKNNSRPTTTRQVGTPVQNTRRPTEIRDFGLLKVRGMKIKQTTAIIKEGQITSNFARMTNERLIQIVQGTDLAQIRALSRWFAQTNGIYSRAVRYIADLYRYDFMIYPNIDLEDKLEETQVDKIEKKLNTVLEHFDASAIQQMCRKWANTVCLDGVYYGYICDDINDKLVIQDLPVDYCRSRFLHRGLPLIEFNVEYFEKVTSDPDYREKLLNLFPEEFRIGFRKFEKGKLQPETQGDNPGWIMLDINRAFKFNFCGMNDLPPFLSAIPALIELGEVQDLEKEKLLQQIQKILVQTFELDKNGQIPFTMQELARLNQNAIEMVGDAVGVSVLSTVATVHLENLAPDSTGTEAKRSVEAASDTVYTEMGISTNLFNTTGNLALEKSVVTDQAFVKPLMLQFEQFLNNYIIWKFNKKELKFRMKMLETTVFNYSDMSKQYESLTKIGFSRFIPMVSLGHSQKEVASLAKLEQQIMELDNWMLPPFSSNTMSSDTWSDIKTIQQTGGIRANQSDLDGNPLDITQTDSAVGHDTTGRPELPEDELSDKTIANRASQ